MISKFLSLIDNRKKKLAVSLLLGGFASATIPYVAIIYMQQVINRIEEMNLTKWLILTGVMLGALCILNIINLYAKKYIDERRECCKRDIEEKIVEKSFGIDYEEIERQDRLDILRATHNSTESVGGTAQQINELFSMVLNFFSIMYSVIFVVTLFARISPKSTGFFAGNASTVVLFGFYFLVTVVNIFLLRIIQKNYNVLFASVDRTNSVGEYLSDSCFDINNGKDFRIYGLDKLIDKYWKSIYTASLKKYLEVGKKGGVIYGVMGIIAQVATGLSYFIIGAKAYYGSIGVGDVILYVSAVNISFTAMSGFISSLSGFRYRYRLFEKYISFLNIPDEIEEGTLSEKEIDFESPEIEFHDVSFRYPNAESNVIDKVNFKVNSKEKVAIVGQNGAGKTTLVKLLCRLYKPSEGYITINGININDIPAETYKKALSVVFQDYELFSYSISDNITAGKTPCKNINDILKQLKISDRILSYPEGMDTRLHNDNGSGVDLSGGESQKIALGRAIYKDGEIMILDEPTASIDPVSEEDIFNNMLRMSKEKTTVFISHRMSSCRACDKIIVLEKGRIKEIGSHDELMARKGLYEELFMAQARYYENTAG